MSAIFGKFFGRGLRITIADGLTPAWDQEFPIRNRYLVLNVHTDTD